MWMRLMWKSLALIVILAAFPIASTLAASVGISAEPGAGVSRAADDERGNGDGNRGHGNDPEGVDQDNPGRGLGSPGSSGDASGNAGDANQGMHQASDQTLTFAASYRVEVDCDIDRNDDETECEFEAQEPDDGEDVIRLIVPADLVCAEVVDGNYEIGEVRGDPGVRGYASVEDDDDVDLDLRGDVRTTGTATYWVQTVDGLFPAEGPGLQCAETEEFFAPGATATDAPTPTPEITTGSLVVAVSLCHDVPGDTSEFDWFGECQPSDDPQQFRLLPDGADDVEALTAETGDQGEARFGELEPGIYHLEPVDATWCHAKADRVTSGGEVVIEATEQTTVWTFFCDESPTGR